MKTIIDNIFERIEGRMVPFFFVLFIAVLLSYALLVIVDFIPEPVSTGSSDPKEEEVEVVEEEETVDDSEESEPEEPEGERSFDAQALPTKIIFDSLDREVVVLNPSSHEIADLDAALLEGAVRHPDSADLSDPGNIFILGHSSYLPNVFNKNFQAFNGIQELDFGDTIRLQSGDMEYIYFVEKVFQGTASELTVPVTPGEANLTLATCNSFGSKDARFIVESKLVSKKRL
ncbi:MAG: LPXTG-site transpeptidase (sortase) family protein [Candidatus Azotimanducaceae bacterium]|jgi:LPXTG-site transpeptidase (sortase) family protein